MALGQRVKERRTALGFSQEHVAHQAGLSWAAVQRLEAGKIADPHYSTLSAIAHALGTTVAELVGEEAAVAPLAEASEAGPSAKSAARPRASAVPNLAMPEETFLALADDQINEIFKALEEGRIPIEPARENVKKAVRQLVKQGSRPS